MQDGRKHSPKDHFQYPAPAQRPVIPSHSFGSGSIPQFPPLPYLSYTPQDSMSSDGHYNTHPPHMHFQPAIQSPEPVNLPIATTSASARTQETISKSSSGGKTFRCTGFEGCHMSFSRSEHLARHVRKHTGEKPFACRCGKKFTRLDNLRQHASTIHADEPEANEELFARLSANLPRSGRTTRRKPAKAKNTAQVDGESPTAAQQLSGNSQMKWLPDLPHTQTTSAHQLATLSGPSDMTISTPVSSNALPHPMPSPSFRFPSLSHSHHAYSGTGYSTSHTYQDSVSSFVPPPRQNSYFNAYQQHHIAQHTDEHPSHAQDYGRDGSSFRLAQYAPSVSSGIEYSSADQHLPTRLETTGVTSSKQLDAAGTASTPTKVTLPSLSSLIAGAPARITDSVTQQDSRDLSASYSARSQPQGHQRLHSTLLAAAEMASVDTMREESLIPYDSRSSSFSTSSANTSGRRTNRTSPATISPCSAL